MDEESAYLLLDEDWNNIIHKWNQEELKCTRCKMLFKEIENIGLWKCSQHASEYLSGRTSQKQYWSCCNRIYLGNNSLKNIGCIKADHTTLKIPFNEDHDMPIPIALSEFMNLNGKSVVFKEFEDISSIQGKEELYDTIQIRRFDWKDAEKKGRLDLKPFSVSHVF